MPNIPVTWLNEFVANLTIAGSQNDPDIIQLANGNILISWASNDDTGVGSPTGLDVIGQIFDPLGNRIGTEIRLNNGYTIDDESNVDMAAMTDGGFITVFEDNFGGVVSLRLNEYNADGTFSSSSSIENDVLSALPNFRNPHVAVSSTTSALIVYERVGSITSTDTDIVGRIYDPSTNAMGSEFNLIAFPDNCTNADVTTLTNGNYVIVAQRDNSGDNEIITRIVDSSGTNVQAVDAIPLTSGDGDNDFDPSVAALAGGGFVVTWSNSDVNDLDTEFAVFSAAGAVVTSSFISGAGAADSDNEAVVAGLADGSFVIAYDDDVNDVLEVQHFSATGSNLGTFQISADAPTNIAITDLADGRFAVAWEGSNGTGEIMTEILDTRDAVNSSVYTPDQWQIGTVGDDVFTADGFSEFVHGHDGNDTITESGQVREYYGDAGNDTLNVVSPINSDLHDGGTGTDTIDWSAVGESGATFDLAAGTATDSDLNVEVMVNFENLNGTDNADNIIGSSGSNVLNGNAGNDSIQGGSGTDTIHGGDGNDTIDGGTFNEFFVRR